MDNSNRLLPHRKINHECFPRNDTESFLDHVRIWYLLPVHFISIIAFSSTIFLAVDNHSFSTGPSSGLGLRSPMTLHQSDVTTLVSVFVMGIRLIVGSWSVLSTWRCALILLEKCGLTLRDLSSIISFKVIITRVKPPSNYREARWTYCLCAFICMLLFPVQYCSPIATGSISWIPRSVPGNNQIQMNEAMVAGLGWGYDWYTMYPQNRYLVLLRAAALGSLIGSGNNTDVDSLPRTSRIIMPLEGQPINTTLSNVTLPYFNVTNLSWIQDPNDFPPDIEDSIKNMWQMNVTRTQNLTDPVPGNVFLIDKVPWTPSDTLVGSHSALPIPEAFYDEQQLVALLVNRLGSIGVPCPNSSQQFGNYSQLLAFVSIPHYGVNTTDCYAIGKVQYTAGVVQSEISSIVAGSIVQDSTILPVLQDQLVPEVFAAMPEVMHTIATMSFSSASLLINMDFYVRRILVQAYCGSWSSMSDYFAPEVPVRASTNMILPVNVVEAHVEAWRIWLWLGLNCLMPISGIVLWVVQRCSLNKPTSDPVLTAIMMDASRLLEKDTSGLCNAVTLSKLETSPANGALLRLRRPQGRDFFHFVLDYDDESSDDTSF
jgi:hypothetical protein